MNESKSEIPHIEIKPVDADQREFDFISQGKRITAVVYDMHKKIRLQYPSGAVDDIPIKFIVDGSARYNEQTDESVKRWIRKDVVRISDEQQRVVVSPNETKMLLHNGILGQYNARWSSDIVSLTLPRITISGTVEDLRLLEDYFNLLEQGQLIRFLDLIESKQQESK